MYTYIKTLCERTVERMRSDSVGLIDNYACIVCTVPLDAVDAFEVHTLLAPAEGRTIHMHIYT